MATAQSVTPLMVFESSWMQRWYEAYFDGTGKAISVAELIEQIGFPSESLTRPLNLEMIQSWLGDQATYALSFYRTIGALREALVVSPEDIEYCFENLPETKKNHRIRLLLMEYTESPLADESTRTLELIDRLKAGQVQFSAEQITFVPAPCSSLLFQELAKSFLYAHGVAEVKIGSPVPTGKEFPRSLATQGTPTEIGKLLADRISRWLDQGVPPQQIHVPFWGEDSHRELLGYRLASKGIPFQYLSEEEDTAPQLTYTDLIQAIHRAKEIPLRKRIETVQEVESLQTLPEAIALIKQRYSEAICKTLLHPVPRPTPALTTSGVVVHPPAHLPYGAPFRVAPFLTHKDNSEAHLLFTEAEVFQLRNLGFPLVTGLTTVSDAAKVIAADRWAPKHRPHFFFTRSYGDDLSFRSVQWPLSPSPFPQLPQPPEWTLHFKQPPQYLSATQLESFATCPTQYFLRYGLGLRPPAGFDSVYALKYGQAVHATLESALTKKANPERELMESTWDSVLETLFEPEEKLGRLLRPMFRAQFKQTLENFIQLEPKLTEFLGDHVPAALEAPFSLHMKNIQLKGKIDRVDRSSNGQFLGMDYKTGNVGFSPKQIGDGTHFQALVYLLQLEKQFGDKLAGFVFYDLKKPEIRRGIVFTDRLDLSHELTRGHALTEAKWKPIREAGIAQIEKIEQAIAAGNFEPHPSAKACQYCDYSLQCRQGAHHA